MPRNIRHRAGIRALMGLLELARYCFDSVHGGLEHWLGGVLDWPMYLSKNEAWKGRKSMKMVVRQGLGLSLGTSWDS